MTAMATACGPNRDDAFVNAGKCGEDGLDLDRPDTLFRPGPKDG